MHSMARYIYTVKICKYPAEGPTFFKPLPMFPCGLASDRTPPATRGFPRIFFQPSRKPGRWCLRLDLKMGLGMRLAILFGLRSTAVKASTAVATATISIAVGCEFYCCNG
jgi:hypothetical protein